MTSETISTQTARTFLYAWELGANFGHVGAFAPFAAELQAQGHAVHFVVRDTAQCARLLPPSARWFQAPVVTERPDATPPLNYGDILLRFGYDDATVLHGLLVGWQAILEALRPDVVVVDHAPTAILAARCLGIPVMLFGAGFIFPPRQDPFPNMRFWEPVAPGVLQRIDAAALATINAALDAVGSADLARLSDLFDVAEDTLMGVPELDHYPGRGSARYWGARGVFRGTAFCPAWEDDSRPRIFGYLRPEHPQLAQLLAALGHAPSPYQVLLCIPGWDGRHAVGPAIRVVTELVDLAAVSAGVALAIAYGSGTTGFLLSVGVPVLCLPMQLENYLLGLRVASLGAGAVVSPDAQDVDFAALVAALLADAQVTTRARQFAARYAVLTHEVIVGNVVRRAMALAQS